MVDASGADVAPGAAGTGHGVLKTGGDSWLFVTADYAFGHSLGSDARNVVTAGGARVLGSARHPVDTWDFASSMLQAPTSKAKVVALANAGDDTANALKTANDFGTTRNQQLAGVLVVVNAVQSLGLKTTRGMLLTESFYWT